MRAKSSPCTSRLLARLAFALAVTAGWADAAPINAVTQFRLIGANASSLIFLKGSNFDSDDASASDFGPFADTVNASTFFQEGNQSVSSSANGSQNSSIGPSEIQASGVGSVNASLTAGTLQNFGQASFNGRSFFDLTFDVTEASSYSLTGSVDVSAIVIGGANIPGNLGNSVLFENLDTSTVLFEALSDDEVFSINGFLSPGQYRLRANAQVSGTQNSSESVARAVSALSSFDLTLTLRAQPVPEPATLLLALTALALLGLGRRGLRSARARLSAG
jgi:hypothetical protein